VAWLMPILYLLAGLTVVVVVMKRWRKRRGGNRLSAGRKWRSRFAGALGSCAPAGATRDGGMN